MGEGRGEGLVPIGRIAVMPRASVTRGDEVLRPLPGVAGHTGHTGSSALGLSRLTRDTAASLRAGPRPGFAGLSAAGPRAAARCALTATTAPAAARLRGPSSRSSLPGGMSFGFGPYSA